MKKVLFTLVAFLATTIVVAQQKVSDVAQFKKDTIKLGKIKVGNPTSATFQLVNTGKQPLIIETVNPTCGCTTEDFTKSPIMAGKTGEIKATYNAANIGAFTKDLTVKFAGVKELKTITIKGEVLSAEDYAKLPPASTKATIPVKAANSATNGQKTKVQNK